MSEETEGIRVQEAVSRADSVRHRLAEAAWGVGASAFVANGVPFSFTTGPALANGAADLIVFLSEGSDARPVTVHDVGAGTGYLTRHVIETLARRDPELARLCAYAASDSNSASVAAIDRVLADLPDDLRSCTSTRIADALSPNDIVVEGPSLTLMSYLIDAIPPQHLVRSDAGLNEVLVETWLASGFPVLDASTWPPRVLQDEALAEVLRSSPESLSPGAALQVLPLIMEAAIEGEALASAGGSVSPFVNTRPGVTAAVVDCVTRMADDSVILVTDFGYSGERVPDAFDTLMTEYGTTAAYAVFFDELQEAAERAGALCCLRAGQVGGTHTLAIYKGNRKTGFQEQFEASFGTFDPDYSGAEPHGLGSDAKRGDVLKAEKALRAMMEEGGVLSYADLANLAHTLARHGRYEAAREFAVICDSRYGLIAAPEQLLLGDLAERRGDSDGALAWYERARAAAPTYGSSHLKAAERFLSLRRYADYVTTMMMYVRVTDEPVWIHVAWLGEVSGHIPEDVPDPVRGEFSQLLQAEFGRES